MLAVSTTCLGSGREWTLEDFNRLLDLDVHGHELGPLIPVDSMARIVDAIRSSRRVVTNLAGPCPAPKALGKQPASAWPGLSDLDAQQRKLAVDAVVETLDWAARIECPIVVVECGSTTLPDPTEEFDTMVNDGSWHREDGTRRRKLFLADRAARAAAHRDALCFALDPLLERAEELELQVALNHQLNPAALPDLSEFAEIMETFRGGPIRSWYATGRSHGMQRLGFEDPMLMRSTVIPAVAGCCLEDVTETEAGERGEGDYQRALLPGHGMLDFVVLTDGIREDAPLVLQPGPWHQQDDIGASLQYLRNLGLEGPPPEACEPFPIIGGS